MECERGGRVEDVAAEVSEDGPGSTQADCVRVPVSPDLFAKGRSVCQVLTRPPNASAGSRERRPTSRTMVVRAGAGRLRSSWSSS
jgi:hypothetical protein